MPLYMYLFTQSVWTDRYLANSVDLDQMSDQGQATQPAVFSDTSTIGKMNLFKF